jgi:carbon monoxide dehydrogenase subunit G
MTTTVARMEWSALSGVGVTAAMVGERMMDRAETEL